MDNSQDDWEPPTEAEMKVIEARRERQNKISAIIGDYLLKGYKMLATTCGECNTVLLRRKSHGVELPGDYCVACTELVSDVDKDNPAVNEAAALSQAQEGAARNAAARNGASTVQVGCQSSKSGDTEMTVKPDTEGNSALMQSTVRNLHQKLNHISQELLTTRDREEALHLCDLFAECTKLLTGFNEFCKPEPVDEF